MFQGRKASIIIINKSLLCSTRIIQGKTLFTRYRYLSSKTEPSLDVSSFQQSLQQHASSISKSLINYGYYTTPTPYSMLPKETIQKMRDQSINLRNQGRYEQSWSEKIDAVTGQVTRFDKRGVFACEPDGQDYDTAPDLIMYLSVLLQTLPGLLNKCQEEAGDVTNDVEPFGLSMSSFNAKLAVTSPGGSVYPLHIDNPQGIQANDIRKLTCILYLNPEYEEGDGGELRIFSVETQGKVDGVAVAAQEKIIDIPPDGGRMVLFWSDEIPHEVLPTSPNSDVGERSKDRYALTLWIPSNNYQAIHNPRSKFAELGDEVFQSHKDS